MRRVILVGLVVGVVIVPTQTASAASPPNTPELLAPSPGYMFGPAEPQIFNLRVTDPDGDPWVGIIEVTDRDDPDDVVTFSTLPGSSGGVAAGLAIPPLPLGSYSWRARAVDSTGLFGPWSLAEDFTVGSNRAPDAPTLLIPADGATLRQVGNEPFSISALDPDGDAFTGNITIRRVDDGSEFSAPTTAASSGGVASAVVARPLEEGEYTWSAQVRDIHGAPSEPSPNRSFTVGPSPSAGGGPLAGSVTYDSPGVPLAACEPVSSNLDLDSVAAVVNTVIVGYVGPVGLEGTGTSSCETARFGSGDLTIDVYGTAPNESTLSCPDLTGPYLRVETSLYISLEGGCVVNSLSVSSVTLNGSLQLVPEEPRDGVTERLETSRAAGAFTVVPD